MTNTQQLNMTEEDSLFRNATGKLDYGLTNDYMFHVVMQKNEKVLRGLVGSLLGLPQDEIVSVELKNPIIPGEAIKDKDSILDLNILLNNQRIINIEMQVAEYDFWPERSLTYLCKNFIQLRSGDDYEKVMPCLHIGILDFDLFEEDTHFYSRYRLLNVENRHTYTTKFGINVLQLRRIDNATEEDRKNELDVGARLIKATTWKELKQMAEEHEFVKEAANSIFAVSRDEAVRLECEAIERARRDKASIDGSGERAGIRKGREEGIGIAIRGALSQGKTPEEIAAFTGIPLDDVMKYVAKFKNLVDS